MTTVSEIPLTSEEASFKTRTVLDDVELVLRFDFNSHAKRWHLSIYDSAENPLACGICMNVHADLNAMLEVNGLPSGLLMLFDSAFLSHEAGVDDLGSRNVLMYETEA
jgi:hypothetical protein